MSAVSEDAIAVAQGDRRLHEIDASWAKGGRRGWLMRRLLLLADVIGLVTSYVVAIAVAAPAAPADRVGPGWEIVLFVATIPFWVLLARVYGLYDRDEERTDHSTVDDVVGVVQVVTLGTWSFLVLTHLAGLPYPNLGRLVIFWFLAIVLVPVLRAVSRTIGRRQSAYIQNVIIVGSGYVARLLAEKIEKHSEYGLRVVGFVDRDDRIAATNGKIPFIGSTDDLPALVRQYGAQRVAIAFSTDSHDQTLQVIRSVQDVDLQIDIVPRMFEVLGTNAQLHTIEGMPLVGLPSPRLSGSSRFLKRSLDLSAARAGLVILAPVFFLVALAIKLDSRGPVFFRQVRMGAGTGPSASTSSERWSRTPNDAEGRPRAPQHAQRQRPADVQGPGGSAGDPSREVPPALAHRRASPAPERRRRAGCPRRAAPAHPRGDQHGRAGLGGGSISSQA